MSTPLSPAFPACGIPRFRDVWLDDSSTPVALWLEQRPEEQGRTGLFMTDLRAPTCPRRASPEGFDVRSRVHEYGGGALFVYGPKVWASSGADSRLWTFRWANPEGTLRPLTPTGPWRFADFRLDPARPRLYTVVEALSDGSHWPRNAIAAVPLSGGAPRILVEGADFYASPRPSPDGRFVAWVQWRLPHLPWEATELYVAAVDATGALVAPRRLLGDAVESIVDPSWGPDGTLWFASDRAGQWNLYRAGAADGTVLALPPLPADMALPHWVFDRPLYGFDGSGQVVAVGIREGLAALWRLTPDGWERFGRTDEWSTLEPLRVAGQRAIAVASGPYRASSVVTLSLDDRNAAPSIVRAATDAPRQLVDYTAEALALSSRDGGTVHAFLYRPARTVAVPAIVSVHGGPTAQAAFAPDATVLFWLSQGFAWLDVNYGGSTGFGRAYRERLRHRWGDVDVADCEDAAQQLVDAGVFDGKRVAIRGGSAGGYTALRAATRENVFSAATVAYGVSDLLLLFRGSHKFEAGYGASLLGTEDPHELRVRSPVTAPEAIRIPVLFLQGLEDTVVPPAQSERMYAALRKRGLEAEYVAFPNEGHGFRRADTLERALAAELAFYRRVLGR
jgi:dipeptidyl aminopeptidase/acylaminoacyl peptidase